MKKLFVNIALLFFVSAASFGQNTDEHSLRPVASENQFSLRTLKYRINLDEKQNRHLSPAQGGIAAVLIEAVKSGIIRPFENDSLNDRMPYEIFVENLCAEQIQNDGSEWGTETGENPDEEWGDGSWGDGTEADEAQSLSGVPADDSGSSADCYEYLPGQLKVLEISCYRIFDRKTSRYVRKIRSVSIKIPAALNAAGLEENLATFSYRELVENVFRGNSLALAFNNRNEAARLTFEEVFEQGLFSAHLVKYANWDDSSFADLNGGEGKKAVIAAKRFEQQYIADRDDIYEN